MSPMNPGKLNRRITIQQKTITRDAEGFPVEQWVDYATPWAGQKALSGREFFAAAAVNAENTVRYEIRYRTDIRPDMRIVDKGQIYNITACIDDPYGNRTRSHLMAKEELRNG